MLALAWPNHVHHRAAHQWFSENDGSGWATCPQTDISFLRLSMQPAVVKSAITFADAMIALTTSLTAPEHEFWPLDYPITEIMPEVRIASHLHLNDALLLDLAIRHKGKLATFDRRLASLLAAESSHRNTIEILPIE